MSCCNLKDPKSVFSLCFRMSFGLSLVLIGVAHYMGIDGFKGMVADGLGPLSGLGTLWAFILPALQIAGGALLVANTKHDIMAWCVGLGLGSIPVGILLKPVLGGAPLGEVMPMAQNALIWLTIFTIGWMFCGCCKKEGGQQG